MELDFDLKQYIPVKNSLTSLIMHPYFITIVDLDFSEKGVILNNLVTKNFPQALSGTEMSAAINQLCSQNNLTDLTVSNMVDGSQLMIKQVSIPKMPPEEVVESLRWSERDAAPFDLETAYMDYAVVEESESEQGEDNILLVAAPKEFIDDIYKTIRNTRLRITAISIIPAALTTLIQHSTLFNPEISVPFINMGSSNTGIYIFQDNALHFSRDLPIGGRSFVDALMNPAEEDNPKNLNLSRKEALEILDVVGIPIGDPEEVVWGELTNDDIETLLNPVLDRFLTEVGRSIDYYKHQRRYEEINNAYLMGRSSNLKNLAKYLTDNLNIEFSVYNPFDDFIKVEKPELRGFAKEGHVYAVPIGIALEQGEFINLLPENKRYSYDKVVKLLKPIKMGLAAILVIFCLVMGGKTALSFMDSRIDKYKAELEQLRQKNTAITILEKKVSVLEHQQQKIITERTAFPVLSGRKNPWEEIFREISLIMPPNARLESCQVNFNTARSVISSDGTTMFRQVIFEGSVRGKGFRPIRALNDLLRRLEGSRFFKNVTFSRTELGEAESQSGTGAGDPGGINVVKQAPLIRFTIYADLTA